MAREEIDLKSIKKLNVSGKPKKKSTVNKKFAKPHAAKSTAGAKTSSGTKTGGGVKSGKPSTSKNTKSATMEKSLPKKPAVKKTTTVKVERVPEEWLYMNAKTADVEVIKKACESLELDVEFWSELGIIEVNIDDVTSMDFEMMDTYEVDEATTEFTKENQIKLAMVVSVRAEKLGRIKDIMKRIADETAGFFCVDDGKFKTVK